jgi:putative DNA primase/helicase
MSDYQFLQSTMDPLARSALALNDLGNARRAISYVRGRLFWIEDDQAFVWFDGQRFTHRRGKAAAKAVAICVADGMADEITALYGASEPELKAVYGPKFTSEAAQKRALALVDWRAKSGESAKANAMIEQAKGLTGDNSGSFLMQAEPCNFDTDPLAYHCGNGVIRFDQGDDGIWRHNFTPGHHPDDKMRQMAGWHYDPDAQAPHWRGRLALMQPDPLAQTALKRIYGMTMTGLTDDQAFYIFQGKGQDGKSATNEVIGVGHADYFRQAGVKTFLDGPETSSGGPQTDLVRLSGDVRMVVCDEPKPGSRWNGERIKQFTGSVVTARGAYARTEESFTPRGKLIAECNQLPKPPSDDRGFRRRHKVFPFTVQFGITPGVPDDPISVVKKRLRSELSGILNWMIEGALEWLNDRTIPEPLMAARANESYWSGSSVLGDFIKDQCDLADPEARIGASDLYKAFRQYRLDAGDDEKKIMSQTAFGSALTNMQIYSETDKRGYKVRKGIALTKRDLASGGQGGSAVSGADEVALSADDFGGYDDVDF